MRALLISLLAAALLLPLSASAGGRKEKCPNRWKAKRAFDAGHLAYRRGMYEEAILKFQDSYSQCEKALTLLAIGNAYERLGDLEAAVEHLEKYQPHAERRERPELESRIATLKSRIEEQEKQEAERKAQEEAARKEALRKAEEDRQRKEEAAREAEAKPFRLAGWITGAVGVAALTGGAVIGGLALSLDGDLADACVEGTCPADRGADVDQLERLSTATDVLLVLGGTLTAGGVALLLVGQSSESSPSVGLTLGPGGAALRGSF